MTLSKTNQQQKTRIRDGAPHHGSRCVMVFWHQLGTNLDCLPPDKSQDQPAAEVVEGWALRGVAQEAEIVERVATDPPFVDIPANKPPLPGLEFHLAALMVNNIKP